MSIVNIFVNVNRPEMKTLNIGDYLYFILFYLFLYLYLGGAVV